MHLIIHRPEGIAVVGNRIGHHGGFRAVTYLLKPLHHIIVAHNIRRMKGNRLSGLCHELRHFIEKYRLLDARLYGIGEDGYFIDRLRFFPVVPFYKPSGMLGKPFFIQSLQFLRRP